MTRLSNAYAFLMSVHNECAGNIAEVTVPALSTHNPEQANATTEEKKRAIG